jgi:hypothetical protein
MLEKKLPNSASGNVEHYPAQVYLENIFLYSSGKVHFDPFSKLPVYQHSISVGLIAMDIPLKSLKFIASYWPIVMAEQTDGQSGTDQ